MKVTNEPLQNNSCGHNKEAEGGALDRVSKKAFDKLTHW